MFENSFILPLHSRFPITYSPNISMRLTQLFSGILLILIVSVFHSCKEDELPSCSDGIQNGAETDVDCGGSCPECPSCTDGIQNGTETGIDCGGSCPECPSCTDGIQNGTETGVDCGGSCPECFTCGTSTISDIDGNVYQTVQIDGQCWMAENLKVERYLNGDAILTGLDNSAWEVTTSGAFAVYNNEPINKATYGLLYNWYASVDSRGLCPSGWHVPADDEFTDMIYTLGAPSVAGGKLKSTGTLSAGTGLWLSPNTAATNSSGFSGLPSGYRNVDGLYLTQGKFAYWWSSSEHSTGYAYIRMLFYDYGVVHRNATLLGIGISIRCIQD